jgi:GTPase Era involved in 16S rRNA processing
MDSLHLSSGESLLVMLAQLLFLMNPEHIKANRIAEATKISHLANKRIKTLLSCCATSAKQFNPEMKMYYQRRIAEGKNQMSTLNIVRNKILARIFAVVQRGTPYVDTYKFAA